MHCNFAFLAGEEGDVVAVEEDGENFGAVFALGRSFGLSARKETSAIEEKQKARTSRLAPCSNCLACSAFRYSTGGRNTSEGVRNSTFGTSETTRTRSNLPFFPPLPTKLSKYWLARCIWISSKYGFNVTGEPKPR